MGAKSAIFDRLIACTLLSVYTCPSWKRRDCRMHLAVLQTSPYFDSCVCDPKHSDASSCLDVQKTIFLHACVLQEGNHARSSHTETPSNYHFADNHLPPSLRLGAVVAVKLCVCVCVCVFNFGVMLLNAETYIETGSFGVMFTTENSPFELEGVRISPQKGRLSSHGCRALAGCYLFRILNSALLFSHGRTSQQLLISCLEFMTMIGVQVGKKKMRGQLTRRSLHVRKEGLGGFYTKSTF